MIRCGRRYNEKKVKKKTIG